MTRASQWKAEHGITSPKPKVELVIGSDPEAGTLIGVMGSHLSTPPSEPYDIEPRSTEPHIEIEDTKVSTRGGNLASTALASIMETFNAASRKKGFDKSSKGVPDHRFNTHFGGVKASLPHIVAGFMDGKAVGATLQDDDKFYDREPPHKRDIEVLNGSDVKRAAGKPEELIADEEAELKKWLVENYGAGAEQKIQYAYSNDKHKVTHEDREKLVEKVRELEDDAKKIASGEMLPYGSVSSDDEPMNEEELDISRHGEEEVDR